MSTPIVVVGAGHAGVHTTSRLVELGYRGELILIDEEDGLPYERPPLSKDVLASAESHEPPALRKQDYYEDKGIRRIAGSAVTAVDRSARRVCLADDSAIPYHRLILATGSRARTLDVPGAALPGVQVLKTRADGHNLKAMLRAGVRFVIVGAGYIGMEVAAAAVKSGCSATVLEYQNRSMSRVTSEEVSRYFEDLHVAEGVRFAFGSSLERIEGSDRVEGIVTSDGETIPADVVVVGIGVLPNQELAEVAGLDCSDGIVVDEHARTSDPEIYAVGDVTRFTCPREGASMRLECVQNAMAQADSAARHILGLDAAVAEVPWFWTVQHGARLQTAGVRSPEDQIVRRGDPADGKFAVLYLRDGRLAALDTINALGDFAAGKKLIAACARLDPVLAADRAVKLATTRTDALATSR